MTIDKEEATRRIMNGGVKHVYADPVGELLISVRILDQEGRGPVLARFTISQPMGLPTPTAVEEELLLRYEMGPTWFWTQPYRNAGWIGEFAHYTNHKYSDAFTWGRDVRKHSGIRLVAYSTWAVMRPHHNRKADPCTSTTPGSPTSS